MTKKEEELIKALLNWKDKEAPDAAYILTKGIDLEIDKNFTFYKKALTHLLNRYTGQRNPETNRIALKHFIPYLIKEAIETYVINLEQAMKMLVLYHFHPQKDDNYFEFNESIGAFDPVNVNERFSLLLDGFSINDGEPHHSNWNYGPFSNSNSFLLHLIGECPLDIDIDESLRARNITILFICFFDLMYIPSLDKMTALTQLHCGFNQITSLDVSQNTALTELSCDNNQLTSLDVSQNTALTELWCSGNQLTTLDVSQNTELVKLSCHTNQLSSEQKQQIKAQFPFAQL